jgi:hypothetical protein
MTTDARQKAEAFKAMVEKKIHDLVVEFAEGKISREQFNILYERYNGQLSIATQALISGNPDAVTIAQGGPPTVMVKDEYMGKAMGMLIFHNKSGTALETLGEFDVALSKIMTTLNEYSFKMDAGEFVELKTEKVENRSWLLFAPGKYTTIVTEFRNEPSQLQIREIERLHHDFEQANKTAIQAETADSDKLAYPFLVFIRKKFGKEKSG